MTMDFSSEIMEVRKKMAQSFSAVERKKKNLSTHNPIAHKNMFRNGEEITIFLENGKKNKTFVTSK